MLYIIKALRYTMGISQESIHARAASHQERMLSLPDMDRNNLAIAVMISDTVILVDPLSFTVLAMDASRLVLPHDTMQDSSARLAAIICGSLVVLCTGEPIAVAEF